MDDFKLQIFAVIHQIPHGKVSTYGDIAHFAGFKGYARQVGHILKNLPKGSNLPWHRVINSKGELSLIGERYAIQRELLEEEGVVFNQRGKIALKQFRWQG